MLAAYAWLIRLDEWYRMPRSLRLAHIAVVRADQIIKYYSIKDNSNA